MKISLLYFTMLATLIGCASTGKKNNPSAAHSQNSSPAALQADTSLLSTTKWRLLSFVQTTIDTSVYDQGLPTLSFDLQNSKMSGNSGCNNFICPITISGANLQPGDILSTKKFCMGIPETEFFNELKKVNRWLIQADTLKLLNESNPVLIFISDK